MNGPRRDMTDGEFHAVLVVGFAAMVGLAVLAIIVAAVVGAVEAAPDGHAEIGTACKVWLDSAGRIQEWGCGR